MTATVRNFLDTQNVWLCISKDPESTVRADDGYSETVGESYEWVSKLPYGADIKVGDVIAIRNSDFLIGFSVIESIEVSEKLRENSLCPKCAKAQVRERKTKNPRYVCASCHNEFDFPRIEIFLLEHRRALYGAGWVELDSDERTFQAWKKFAKNSKSQHSLQPADPVKFLKFTQNFSSMDLRKFDARTSFNPSGRRIRTVKIREGRSVFRNNLIDQFGNNCAVTGSNHPYGLEAAHLYSYSTEGNLHDHGGLLLRRDIYHFFDRGLIALNPRSGEVDVHGDLLKFQEYEKLHAQKVQLALSEGLKNWLKIHWYLYRE